MKFKIKKGDPKLVQEYKDYREFFGNPVTNKEYKDFQKTSKFNKSYKIHLYYLSLLINVVILVYIFIK